MELMRTDFQKRQKMGHRNNGKITKEVQKIVEKQHRNKLKMNTLESKVQNDYDESQIYEINT